MKEEPIQGGYMGRLLWVNLNAKTEAEQFEIISVEDKVYQQFLTGYGLGAKIIFERQKPCVDPLSGENTLGIMSGLLTGTKVFFTGRFEVIGKSPLTGTWGDSNCGGHFAPAIKQSGFDGIFFTGISQEKVYLLIDGGKISLEKADDLWGRNTLDTETTLKERHGSHFRIACIGTGGEKQSLLASVMVEGGRAAGRSGLGALMGSKHLKAVCLCGTHDIPIVDPDKIIGLNKTFGKNFKRFKNPIIDRLLTSMTTSPCFAKLLRYLAETDKLPELQTGEVTRYVMETWGTSGSVALSANTGDSPVKNWDGSGEADFPVEKSKNISNDAVTNYEVKKYGCYVCPLRCGGLVDAKIGEFLLENAHKVEYETICGFGTQLLSDNLENIMVMNEKLNMAGIDTISCAQVVSWIYEMAESNLIAKPIYYQKGSSPKTELSIKWGSNEAAIHLVDLIIAGEGIGYHLRNGIRKGLDGLVADGYITPENRAAAVSCGMEVGGQELPMHDPRNIDLESLGVAYEAEPTPGRHTSIMGIPAEYLKKANKRNPKIKQNCLHMHPITVYKGKPSVDEQAGIGQMQASCFMDLLNGLGFCAQTFGEGVTAPLVEWLNAATGWDHGFDYYWNCGRRIKTLRHSFNIREKVDVRNIRLPDRIRKNTLKTGPNKGIQHDFEELKTEYFKAMGYDPETLKPYEKVLDDLGLGFVKEQLYQK